MTAPPAATDAGDSGGITGVPAVLPLRGLAAHPRNPRTDLGNLDELAASIAAHGVFEPLVVLSAAAYAAAAGDDGDPDPPAGLAAAYAAAGGADAGPPAGGLTHVIVIGHRRAVAAGKAGLAEVPVVVRDDLAGAPALAAMIAENVHREGLDPLAEARAMAELASRHGWGQRRIAAETGCSQAHVSKRMSLLKLPPAARDALEEGRLTVGDALELQKIHGGADRDIAAAAIDRAASEIRRGQHPGAAISMARHEAARAMTERKTGAGLAARGITVITAAEREKKGWPRVRDGQEGEHGQAGCLAATIGWGGHPEWACTSPDSHPRDDPLRGRARESEDERESRAAARSREAACAALAAGPLPGSADLTRALAGALLGVAGGAGQSETLRLACKWLRGAGTVPAGTSHYEWRDQLARAGDHAGLIRHAWACTVAADELAARWRSGSGSGGGWGDGQAAHLDRLAAAGYQPTAWELARLAEARQVAEARDGLTCPACGCAEAPGCRVEFDRAAGKPAYRCAWNCPAHEAAARAARLEEMLLDLIVAVDVTTAAGSRLPGDAGDAIDGPRRDLAAAYRNRHMEEGTDAVLDAARDLAAAAAPYEASWTLALSTAIKALARHGALSEEGGRR